MSLSFTKMHGCGNDFMLIDMRKQFIEISAEKIKELADYKRSVGFDQLLLIESSDVADISMRIFNNDGIEVSACGNGSRCVAKLILNPLKTTATIATSNRILVAKILKDMIAINMGKAEIIEENIIFGEISGSLVDVGNPHIIINNTTNIDVLKYGPIIETDYRFPNKVNVNFARILDRKTVVLSTWERGAGATLSCGTGACATFFYFYQKNLIDKEAVIKQKGGNLSMSIEKDQIFMAGEAHISYKGTI